MKIIIAPILITILLFGCDGSSKSDEANVALVEKYIQAVESKDYETMASLLDDEYIGLGPSIADSTGRDAALESWKYNIENLYENIEYQRSRNAAITIADGDNQGSWVANWAQLRITYKGDKGSVTIWANTNYQIENNKIIKSYTFYNEADALRQLGYVFIDLNEL